MKKRGFTLVELLAVIVLLGLIALIAFPNILESMNKTNQNVDSQKMKLTYQGAEQYIQKEGNAYPLLEGNTFCISPKTLLEEKFISYEDLPTDEDYVVRAVVNGNGKLNYSFIAKSECIEKGVIAANLGEVTMEVEPAGYAVEKKVTIQYPAGTDLKYSYSMDAGKTWTDFHDTTGEGKLEVTAKNNGYIIARVKRDGELGYKSQSATVTQIDKTPIGAIVAYVDTDIPRGYFAADGSSRAKKTYASLYSIIGNTYGTSNEDTTFVLPNIQGKVIVGQDTNQNEFKNIGTYAGSKTETLTVAELPSHTHVQNAHNHTQKPHTHVQNAHTHTQKSHTHTQNAHNHIQNAHTHGQASHSHAVGNKKFSIFKGTRSSEQVGVIAGTGWKMNQVAKSGGSWGSYSSLPNATATNNGTTASNVAATAVNQNTTAINNNTVAKNQGTTAINQNTTAVNQNTGGGKSHNNLQPYQVLQYMIKYQ